MLKLRDCKLGIHNKHLTFIMELYMELVVSSHNYVLSRKKNHLTYEKKTMKTLKVKKSLYAR